MDKLIDELRQHGYQPTDGYAFDQEGFTHRYQSGMDKEGKRDTWCIYWVQNNGGVAGKAGNWRTGDTHKFNTGGGAKGDGYIKRAEDIAQAVNKAQAAMDAAPRGVPPDHGYLVAKKVGVHRKIKIDDRGNIMIPLSQRGVVTGIRYISRELDAQTGKWRKWSLPGGKSGGAYYVIAGKTDTVYVAEGYATAATAAEATGKMAVMCGDCNNMLATAQAVRVALPDAKIIIVADNDSGTKGNPGKRQGLITARAIGGLICIPNYAGDLNDALSVYDNRDLVNDILASAATPDALEGEGVPEDFLVSDKGVEKIQQQGKKKIQIMVCETPVRVRGYTRDPKGWAWGREVDVTTRDGEVNTVILPASTLVTGTRAVEDLVRAGAVVIPGKDKLLLEYIMRCAPSTRYQCAERLGWLDKEYRQFVMVERTIGHGGENIRYQTEHGSFNPYAQASSVGDWVDDVGKLARGNEIIMLAVCMGLAAPLATILGKEPFGVHIYGEGSIGKSTTAGVAASIWGRPTTDGFLQTWRNTMVAIEELASIYNDSILILDEVGEMDNPRDLQKIIFMLTGGQSKGRGRMQGGVREPKTWRTLFLSTGNGSMAQIVQQAGARDTRMHAGGQAVRRIEIGVTRGVRDIFTDLHGHKTGDDFARALRKNTNAHYGTVGIRLLNKIIDNRNDLLQLWRDYLENDAPIKKTEVSGAGGEGQHLRVYGHFQLLTFAGELCTKWGLTGWDTGEAREAMLGVYRKWMIENRGASNEKKDSIHFVRLLLQQRRDSFAPINVRVSIHGERLGWRCRIERDTLRPIRDDDPDDNVAADDDPFYDPPVAPVARQAATTVWAFFVTRDVFRKEFCKEFAPKTLLNWMHTEGMYLGTKTWRFPGVDPMRYYVLIDKQVAPEQPGLVGNGQ